MTAQVLVTYLTPIIVPLIIAGVKAVQPKIPTFVLPLIAPIFGVLIDIINSYVNNSHPSLLIAAILGLAGVGIREVVDQLKPISDPVEPKA